MNADASEYDSQKLKIAHEKIVDLIYENSKSIQSLGSNPDGFISKHEPVVLSTGVDSFVSL